MKKTLAILTLGTIFFMHCDDTCICDPGPYFADLKVKLTIDDENPEVFLTVFAGNIEDKDTLIAEFVNESTVYYEMEAGRRYSATTHYTRGNRTYIAVDGRKMRISSDDCDCDYGESATLNLRLAD
ncbi:MAG: hypothetical protein RIC35_00640 [Marinoscillum sp.]